MSNNLLVLPLLIPLCTAVILLFMKNRIILQRWVSMIGILLGAVVSCCLVMQVRSEGAQVLHMGGWLPPYGIAFVADMFAALLTLTTAIVAACCLLYSFGSIREERERHYYYPFFQFLLVGVNGSFLTGDLFNLFVCFEVMLISSYALIVLGGTQRQLRETLKYILINILSSTLFVAAVAYVYGVVGTLNMADLSLKIAEAGQGTILTVIALLFMIVFSLKAGLFLFFWLPGSYSAPPAAITALFAALLTKVGLYALIRTFTLIFHTDQIDVHNWFQWMAIATMLLGAFGAVAYDDIRRIMNYNVVISVGFLAMGLAVSSKDALDGVVFYLIHDMLAKALLFILGGLIVQASGTSSLKQMGGLIRSYPLMGGLFFITGLAIAGIPPFSGFPGKFLLLRGSLGEEYYGLSAVALASSLIVLYSLIRIFASAFWGERTEIREQPPVIPNKSLMPAIALSVLVIGVGFGSEYVYGWVSMAGDILVQPADYIDAILRSR
ncbi:Na+/H+ antiporter subunit D [Cohnella sp. CIP 111063]|uniref:Na+/H+ antiporter subunit D n=1 Tax=unclassified Cohnella TaxID=2636738 RepID=UPI000B8C12A7|nr:MULTISPECIES: Na+/H+ antiporter subunit D [unclassified Cohnella]OXS56966.1 Na+/H+ antiporter subunit D [Cohnella sp. CIP 111063]PRX69817.1 multisubunit sodium/proton antiporter MrpD subunit [Cohnella sp. SGD-V74]